MVAAVLWPWQYAEYEQVVVEDRIEKEKARRKVDQEAREIAAAVKVCIILLSRTISKCRTYVIRAWCPYVCLSVTLVDCDHVL